MGLSIKVKSTKLVLLETRVSQRIGNFQMAYPSKNIRIIGDPILGSKVEKISTVNEEVRNTLQDMLRIMYEEEGCGLAANQIGLNKQLVTIDLNDGEDQAPNPRFFVNPCITWYSQEKEWFDERCLSLPGAVVPIERPIAIKVAYQDAEGEQRHDHVEGFLARVLQHEIDHLNGILAVDYLSEEERKSAVSAIQQTTSSMTRPGSPSKAAAQ